VTEVVAAFPERPCVIVVDDAAAAALVDLRRRLRDAVLNGEQTIVVDVSELTRPSSATIAALLGVHRLCRARGGGILLRDPHRRTRDLLRRTGLVHVLRIEEHRSSDHAADQHA
jgi:anti-sigma B factor antagonist